MNFTIHLLPRRNRSLRSFPIHLGTSHLTNPDIRQHFSISNQPICRRTHHRTFGLLILEPPTIWFHWTGPVLRTIPPICQVPSLSKGSTGTPKFSASALSRSTHQMGANWYSVTSSTHPDYLILCYLSVD